MAEVTGILNLLNTIDKESSTEYLAKLSKMLYYLMNNIDSLNVTSIDTSITTVSGENGKTVITGAQLIMKDAAGTTRVIMGLGSDNVFRFSIYTSAGVPVLTLSDSGISLGAGTSISWSSITNADQNALAAWVASGYKTYIDANGVYTGTIAANLAQISQSIRLGTYTDRQTTKYLYFNDQANIHTYWNGVAPGLIISSNDLYMNDQSYISIGNAVSQVSFDGTVDFSSATITGFTAVWG